MEVVLNEYKITRLSSAITLGYPKITLGYWF